MRLIHLVFVSVSMTSGAFASPPKAPPSAAIEAGKACTIDLQDTSSVRASSLINGENFILEIQMRKPDSDERYFLRGNVIRSVAISKGSDEYFFPKDLIAAGYQTTCLFSLGKDRIGFVVQTGSGEKSSLFLYCVDTTNWDVVLEKWSYPTWIYIDSTKGNLKKVKN
jgi:hypothetical protein